MTEPTARSIRSSASIATLANAVKGLCGFVVSVVIGRFLGPAGRGEFTFVTNSMTILVLLAGGGVSSALLRAKARENRSVRELYAASFVLAVMTGAAASATVLVAHRLAPSIFVGVGGGELAWVVALSIPLLTMNSWTAVGYLEDRVREFMFATTAGALALVVAVGALAALGRLSISTLVSSWALTSLIPVAAVARGRATVPSRSVLPLAARLFRYSVRANVATVALVLTWRIDVILVSSARGLSELGLYAVAVGLGEIFVQLAVSIRIALTPRQGAGADRQHLVELICLSSRFVTIVGFVATLVALQFGRFVVISLFGPSFAASSTALMWLMPGVVALMLQGPLIDFLLVEGRVRAVTVSTVVALGVNVVLNLVLLRNHTFVAAAVASTVAYVVSCGCCVALFCRETGRSFADLFFLSRRDMTFAVGAVAGRRQAR